MSTDLTGIGLENFLLSEIRDIAARHPRFRKNAGDVVGGYPSLAGAQDVRIQITNLSSTGNRLSPDNFVATQYGRTTLGKLEGRDGTFLEWVNEVDTTDKTPESGLYYMEVKSENEEAQTTEIAIQKIRWEYKINTQSAKGSIVRLSEAFYGKSVFPTTTDVAYRSLFDRLVILSNPVSLALQDDTGYVLHANTDYWFESNKIYEFDPTYLITIPDRFIEGEIVKITDADGYTLATYDFEVLDEHTIRIYNPAILRGPLQISAYVRMDPTSNSVVHPENYLNYQLGDGEELVLGQSSVTIAGQLYSGEEAFSVSSDGKIYSFNLVDTGQELRYDLKIAGAETVHTLKKSAINTNVIPGLFMAVGDRVVVGDQAVLVVYPFVCDTYEIYGSKENVSFDIEISTNDPITSGEIAEMVKRYFLVSGRERLEMSGCAIFEVARSKRTTPRDPSNLNMNHTVILNVSAAADWEVHVPLITRVETIDIQVVRVATSQANVSFEPLPRPFNMKRQFYPSYS